MRFIREALISIQLNNGNIGQYLPTPIQATNLRISFSINKSLDITTNAAQIKIWNLSQDNRNLLKNFGDKVTLFVGYRDEGNSQIIFIGDTVAVSHIYDQPDIITVLECADGDRYFNQIRVSVSFAANTPASSVLQAIASQIGIQYNPEFVPTNLVYRQGFQACDIAREVIYKACSKLGLMGSIQNYVLQVVPLNPTGIKPPIQINEQTGMQGIPQRFTYRNINLVRPHASELRTPISPVSGIATVTTGYKINMILYPQITPGVDSILLSSRHLGLNDGRYYVKGVRHEGDTYGFQWTSSLEVVEIPSNLL